MPPELDTMDNRFGDLLELLYSGGSRTAERQQALDLLSTSYFNKDYIVVYPNGLDVSRLLKTMSLLSRPISFVGGGAMLASACVSMF